MTKAYLQAVRVRRRRGEVCQEKKQLILEQLYFIYIFINVKSNYVFPGAAMLPGLCKRNKAGQQLP